MALPPGYTIVSGPGAAGHPPGVPAGYPGAHAAYPGAAGGYPGAHSAAAPPGLPPGYTVVSGPGAGGHPVTPGTPGYLGASYNSVGSAASPYAPAKPPGGYPATPGAAPGKIDVNHLPPGYTIVSGPGAAKPQMPPGGFRPNTPPPPYRNNVQGLPMMAQRPPNCPGNVRGLFIGINYKGSQSELKGCVNDVSTILSLLQRIQFPLMEAAFLVDDPSFPRQHKMPTHDNIIEHMQWLVHDAKPGDTLFMHYSGHGTQVPDTSGDEEDGMDEAMVPVDYLQYPGGGFKGMIIDDIIFDILAKDLPAGVRLTVIMDCCHSGSLMDLPYNFIMGKDHPAPAATGHRGFLMKEQPEGFAQVSRNRSAANVVMFSGCADQQTSSDVSNVATFHVPDNHPGQAGGACTNALSEILSLTMGLTYVEILTKMHEILKQRGFSQLPQLSSSKPIDLHKNFNLFGGFEEGEFHASPPRPQEYPTTTYPLPQSSFPAPSPPVFDIGGAVPPQSFPAQQCQPLPGVAPAAPAAIFGGVAPQGVNSAPVAPYSPSGNNGQFNNNASFNQGQNNGNQYPPNGNQYPPNNGNQFPPNNGNQYPPTNGNQYPPNNGNQYPPNNGNQYPPNNGNQYPPNNGNQYPPNNGNQYPPNNANGQFNQGQFNNQNNYPAPMNQGPNNGQYPGNTNTPAQCYPAPDCGNQYPPNNCNQFPAMNGGNQYPPNNGNQYPPNNGNQYPPTNGNQYPPNNGNQYPPNNGNQYPPNNGNQFPAMNGGNQYPPNNGNPFPPSNGNQYPAMNGNQYPPNNNGQYNQPGNNGPYNQTQGGYPPQFPNTQQPNQGAYPPPFAATKDVVDLGPSEVGGL